MVLAPGDRFGSYVVVGPLGAGGMGEVYRAHDARLRRDVALKVLPDAMRLEPGRLARFEQEARALAALNHPGIAAIYGVEEGRIRDDGGQPVQALVLELVEGGTLATRIARGAIPVPEALAIARQIADALEAAHSKGVVHRDLKPANVALTPDGVVKVLDFGLAKIAAPGLSASEETATVGVTHEGLVVGTAAYMSPEQARGQTVDKRTDVWAFGCVLYEMLTGQRLFQGDRTTDTLALLLTKDPDWTALPPQVPPAVRALVRRCLERDLRKRLGDVAAIRFGLEDVASLSTVDQQFAASRPSQARAGRRLKQVVAVGAVALASAALAGGLTWTLTRPVPRIVFSGISATGATAPSLSPGQPDMAITPDGTRVVYVGNNFTQLLVRALDSDDPEPIATGTLLSSPFISPDSRWVGYWDVDVLKKIEITGGSPITLASDVGNSNGATWTRDDLIVFGSVVRGLYRISAEGGTPEPLTEADATLGNDYRLWPELLPDNRTILVTRQRRQLVSGQSASTARAADNEASEIVARDLLTGMEKPLVPGGSHAKYVAGGYLVYLVGQALRAVPFDARTVEVRGKAVTVMPTVSTSVAGGFGKFDVSDDGTLVYIDGRQGAAPLRTLVWVDRTGHEEPITKEPGIYSHPRLSPDDTRVAYFDSGSQQDVWVWHLQQSRRTRVTNGALWDGFPVWWGNGRIIFNSPRGDGVGNLWWQAADGLKPAQRLTTSDRWHAVTGVTPDGSAALFMESAERVQTFRTRLMQVSLDGEHRAGPLFESTSNDANAVVAPKPGRLLAYESDTSGVREIYVRPYPATAEDSPRLVSTGGGTRPLWSRDGKELFFVGSDGALMRVMVEATGAEWKTGAPQRVLEPRYFTGIGTAGASVGANYDVSLDGRRFVMIKAAESNATAPPQIKLIQRFDEYLKAHVPAD